MNREQFLVLVLIICMGGKLCSAQQSVALQQPATDAASQGPSYEDTVKWIKDNISLAGTPSSATNALGNHAIIKSNGTLYTLAIDGCRILTLTEISSGSLTDLDEPTDPSLNDSNVNNTRYKIR